MRSVAKALTAPHLAAAAETMRRPFRDASAAGRQLRLTGAAHRTSLITTGREDRVARHDQRVAHS